MASEEVKGIFCRYDSCVIIYPLATGSSALERELLGSCTSLGISPVALAILANCA